MKVIVSLLAFLILLTGCSSTYNVIPPKLVDSVMKEKENAAFIDIRSTDKYDESHINKFINMPIDKAYNTIIASYDTLLPIIIIGDEESDADELASQLTDAGYKNVSVVEGGMTEYQKTHSNQSV